MDHIRRILLALFVFATAALVFAWWRSQQAGYGLLDLVQGKKPPVEEFTAPQEPKIKLEDVDILARLNEASAKLAEAVLPSVVSVNTKSVVPRIVRFGFVYGYTSDVEPGLGSGAIISKEGHVVTNFHVVAITDERTGRTRIVDEIVIVTNDNKTYPARVIGASRERDIALLKIESNRNDFPALTFADSNSARVGQLVFAVGNPFGLTGTVTQGIISAKNRHLRDSALDYLQTDTVINPGNSGGPLVNIRGEIMGINVAIYQGDENVRAWQGVGLAVPSNDAKAVVDDVLKQTRPATAPDRAAATTNPGYLGLEVETQPVSIDAALGTSKTGALITDVDPGSPAAECGLRPGDVITHFQDRTFSNPSELLAMIRATPASTTVAITILRGGRVLKVQATLTPPPAEARK